MQSCNYLLLTKMQKYDKNINPTVIEREQIMIIAHKP